MKQVSIIICTFNPREDYLQRTLAALEAQTLPKERWELLLIDNASEAPLDGRFDLAWHPDARHLREEKLGKLNAWRLGIMESAADILIFVDDDNVLAKDYLEKAVEISDGWPFIGAWGGSIILEFESPAPAWCKMEAWRLAMVDVREDIWSNIRGDFITMPAGAGMCIRKKVGEDYLRWCATKPLTASLDRSGKGLAGYGDIDLAHCAIDAGFGTGRFKRLNLTHLIPASRLRLDYFLRHAEDDAFSLTMFRAARGFPIEKPGKETLIGNLRWFVHRVKNRVPREIFEIQKAHRRGLEKGYQQATEYLAAVKKQEPEREPTPTPVHRI